GDHRRAASTSGPTGRDGAHRVGPGGPGVPALLHLELHPRRPTRAVGVVRRATPANLVRRERRPAAGVGAEIDVTDEARRVTAPTLVLHARDETRVPVDQARRRASLIPGARFVPLASQNHLLRADEPAWE